MLSDRGSFLPFLLRGGGFFPLPLRVVSFNFVPRFKLRFTLGRLGRHAGTPLDHHGVVGSLLGVLVALDGILGGVWGVILGRYV